MAKNLEVNNFEVWPRYAIYVDIDGTSVISDPSQGPGAPSHQLAVVEHREQPTIRKAQRPKAKSSLESSLVKSAKSNQGQKRLVAPFHHAWMGEESQGTPISKHG